MDEILNSQEDPDTRLEPMSDKESPKVKKSANVLIIHDDEEEEESAGDALIRRKGNSIAGTRESLSRIDDEKLCNDDLSIWWSLKIKFEKPATPATPCRMTTIRTRDHEDHHDNDARLEGESSAKK
ncbi:hypothetical protein Tco_0331978 [Tanacetum coccineum]